MLYAAVRHALRRCVGAGCCVVCSRSATSAENLLWQVCGSARRTPPPCAPPCAPRSANPRAREREQGTRVARRKFSRIADRRRSLSVGVAAVATLRCSPPRAPPRTPWARARSPPRWRGRVPQLRPRRRAATPVRVRGTKGLDSPSRGLEHLRLAPRAHARARRGVAVHTVGALGGKTCAMPHGRVSSACGKTVFVLRVAAFEVKVARLGFTIS